MAIQWESVVRGGKTEPFVAVEAAQRNGINQGNANRRFLQGELRRRIDLGTAPSPGTAGQHISEFQFANAKPGYLIRRGFESDWITGTR
jgi:hypothetical protein